MRVLRNAGLEIHNDHCRSTLRETRGRERRRGATPDALAELRLALRHDGAAGAQSWVRGYLPVWHATFCDRPAGTARETAALPGSPTRAAPSGSRSPGLYADAPQRVSSTRRSASRRSPRSHSPSQRSGTPPSRAQDTRHVQERATADREPHARSGLRPLTDERAQGIERRFPTPSGGAAIAAGRWRQTGGC